MSWYRSGSDITDFFLSLSIEIFKALIDHVYVRVSVRMLVLTLVDNGSVFRTQR